MSSFEVVGYNVVVLPTVVAIYGPGCHQFFNIPKELCPFSDDWAGLIYAWAEPRMYMAAAQLHREGVTDKELFISSVNALSISYDRRSELIDFIHKCDCVPSVIRKKLELRGFSDIIVDLWFERLHPEMDKSLWVMGKFLEKIREEKVQKT